MHEYRASAFFRAALCKYGDGAGNEAPQTEPLSLDGTKVKANASRYSALFHDPIAQLEIQIKAEVDALLALALNRPATPKLWPEESHERMDTGLPRLEFEAHGRIASAIAKTGEIVRLQAKTSEYLPSKPSFMDLLGSSPASC